MGEEPVSATEVMDTHLHVTSPDTGRYPRRPSDGTTWWDRPGTSVDEILGDLERAGVDRGVAVQALGPYGYDNRLVIDVAAEHADRVTAVVAVDVDSPDAPAEITRCGRHAGVVGVRLFAVVGDARWPGGPRTAACLAAARDAGLTIVLTAFQDQLSLLCADIERVPDAEVTLDHCGFPRLESAVVAAGQPVLAFAEMPHVSIKISGHLLTEAAEQGDPAELVAQLTGLYGGRRVMWGSDHPQTPSGGYPTLLAQGVEASRLLQPEDRQAFLRTNAMRLFGPS